MQMRRARRGRDPVLAARIGAWSQWPRMPAIRTRQVEANGLTFAVDEAGEGEDVALLLHGFPEARASWSRQLPALAALGWRAVAADLRGYGDSSRPRGRAAYAIDHLTSDVAALFDVLGAGRRLLIGHDWGGVIAWAAAISGEARLDGLVILNAPHPAVFRKVLRRSWRQRGRSWYVLFFQLPWLPEALLRWRSGRALERGLQRQSRGFPPELLATLRANLGRPGAAKAMIDYYRANAFRIASSGGERRIEVPTLMVWGENDVALDIQLTEGLEAHVADFTLRRLPDASHWVQQDAPDEVNRLITDWMREKGLA
jgi:pimeloyl-ACP methyl ester carboxylesterase